MERFTFKSETKIGGAVGDVKDVIYKSSVGHSMIISQFNHAVFLRLPAQLYRHNGAFLAVENTDNADSLMHHFSHRIRN